MKTLLVLPNYDGDTKAALELRIWEARERDPSLDVLHRDSSALTFNFNCCWCQALNNPAYTHFVMLHSDIVPRQANWLNQLIRTCDAVGADILSVVSPIKSQDGRTTTALGRGDDPVEQGDFRRVTMREAVTLPETFNRKHVASLFGSDYSECHLLVNTGLMVVRMNRRKLLEQMCFTVHNWIKQDAAGKFYAVFEPEDWDFSIQAARLRLSVWATRAVPMDHYGVHAYSNDTAWGTVEHDEGDKRG